MNSANSLSLFNNPSELKEVSERIYRLHNFSEITGEYIFHENVSYTLIVNGHRFSYVLPYSVIRRRSESDPTTFRYEIFHLNHCIGAGSFGGVYPTITLKFTADERIVVKENHRIVKVANSARSNFLNEIAIAREAGHLGVKDQIPNYIKHMVMGYQKGQTLYTVLDDLLSGKITLNNLQSIDLTIELLRALQEQVYAKGIIHCDIKPENIIIDGVDKIETGNVKIKIIDFGLSILRGDRDFVQLNSIRGTPEYRTPEMNQGHANLKTDSFGLARTLRYLWVAAYSEDDRRMMIQDTNKIPNQMGSVIKAMTHYNWEKRLSLEGAIQCCEYIRIDFKGKANFLKATCDAALAARNQYIKEKNYERKCRIIISALNDIEVGNDLIGQQEIIIQFTQTLGLKAFYTLKTKQEILDKIAEINNEYQQLNAEWQKLSDTVNALKLEGTELARRINIKSARHKSGVTNIDIDSKVTLIEKSRKAIEELNKRLAALQNPSSYISASSAQSSAPSSQSDDNMMQTSIAAATTHFDAVASIDEKLDIIIRYASKFSNSESIKGFCKTWISFSADTSGGDLLQKLETISFKYKADRFLLKLLVNMKTNSHNPQDLSIEKKNALFKWIDDNLQKWTDDNLQELKSKNPINVIEKLKKDSILKRFHAFLAANKILLPIHEMKDLSLLPSLKYSNLKILVASAISSYEASRGGSSKDETKNLGYKKRTTDIEYIKKLLNEDITSDEDLNKVILDIQKKLTKIENAIPAKKHWFFKHVVSSRLVNHIQCALNEYHSKNYQKAAYFRLSS